MNRFFKTTSALILAATFSAPAFAGVAVIDVRFDEGAPKDRFTITNSGDCAMGPFDITIDLSTSKSGLVFDVTDQGAGVEVFQPFELVSGSANIIGKPTVADGDQAVTLVFKGLATGAEAAFTIDVDDTTSNRQITVSDSEMDNSRVTVNFQGGLSETLFGRKARATLPTQPC